MATTRWNRTMSIAEMLPLMDDAEIRKNARRGGSAAITELERRNKAKWENDLKAMKIIPTPDLDLGV